MSEFNPSDPARPIHGIKAISVVGFGMQNVPFTNTGFTKREEIFVRVLQGLCSDRAINADTASGITERAEEITEAAIERMKSWEK